jgi:hypothetical protein
MLVEPGVTSSKIDLPRSADNAGNDCVVCVR